MQSPPNTTIPALEVFYAGTHVDSRGRKVTITRSELEASAAAYDPAVFAAPLVIGHPTMDAPAFGHMGKLAVNDSARLIASDHTDVHPEFAALVADKRYPKWSISFFQPEHPSNPKPGVYYPRHLGFLGAAAPALPGLKHVAASFAADDTQISEFGPFDLGTVSALMRGLKNFFFARFGGTPEATDQIERALPEYLLESLGLNAASEAAAMKPMSYGAPHSTSPEGDPMSAELLAAANAARDAAVAEAKAAKDALAASQCHARTVQFAADADRLIGDHSLHPDERESYVAFMAQPDDEATVSFAAADGTAKAFNAKTFLTDFIKRRGALLPKGEAAGGKHTEAAAIWFAAPQGVAINSSRLADHALALAYVAQHKVDYLTAVKAVTHGA